MVIKENNKLYNIDEETGLVTEASVVNDAEEVVDTDEYQDDFRTGDRVTVDGEEGTIVSIISSVYGPAFGIAFDDGSVDEYPEEKLSRAETEEPDYETPLKEVQARFAAYEVLPAYTRGEIEAKSDEARNLNLRAKALITDSKLSYAEQMELDRIVLTTGTDLEDFKVLRDAENANEDYIRQFEGSRFELASEFRNVARVGAADDASWVDNAFVDIEETNDADLAVAAQQLVDNLTVEQLQDEEFVAMASSFPLEYLAATEEQTAKFASYVKEASEKKIADYEPVEETVDESDLDDFDTASLYI